MDEKKVCILDYKSGNVQSVFNMMLTLTPKVVISNRIKDIISATHIVLPGVGAFGSSMKKIKNKIPLSVLEKEVFKKNKPFLGICVGMQVLAERGYEFGEHKGLGWIPGSVEKMDVSKDTLTTPAGREQLADRVERTAAIESEAIAAQRWRYGISGTFVCHIKSLAGFKTRPVFVAMKTIGAARGCRTPRKIRCVPLPNCQP